MLAASSALRTTLQLPATVRLSTTAVSVARGPAVHIDVRIVKGAAGILALGDRWLALEACADGHTFFQSFGWCRHVIEELSRNDAIEPLVATAWDAGRLIAVWPLRIVRGRGARVVSGLGWPYDQSSEVLMDRGYAAASLVHRIAKAVQDAGVADGMVMHKARKGSLFCALTDIGAKIADDGALAPQVAMDTAAPFTTFLSGVSSKTRKNIRNYENRLARLGMVKHRVLTGAEAAAAVVASYDARRDWLDAQGMSSTAFRDQHFGDIVHGLTRGARGGLDLIVFALSLDDKMIAIQWGFVHAGRYYAYLSSRDPAFEAYSVGRIHLQHVLQACHERGIGAIDLMVPAVPYKTTWSDAADSMVDLVWPWTLRGYLTIDLYARHLRPLLKAAAQGMPKGLRQAVYARLNARRRVALEATG